MAGMYAHGRGEEILSTVSGELLLLRETIRRLTMAANVRYNDPFTSTEKKVSAPEGAEYVVVRKRGEAAVDLSLIHI